MIRHDGLSYRTTLMLADGGLAIGLIFLVSLLRIGREEALPTLNANLPGPQA